MEISLQILTDVFKWLALIFFTFLAIILSALSYINLFISMAFSLIVLSFAYMHSLYNENSFLDLEVEVIKLVDETDSSDENAKLLDQKKD